MEKVINNRDEILNLYEELTENNQKLIKVEEIRTKVMKIGRKIEHIIRRNYIEMDKWIKIVLNNN